MKDWLLVFQSKKVYRKLPLISKTSNRIKSNRNESADTHVSLAQLFTRFWILINPPFFQLFNQTKQYKRPQKRQHKRNVIQFHGLPLETLTTLLVIVFSSSINYFTKYCQSVFLISRETYLLKRTISDKPKNEKTFNDIFMAFYIRLPWFIKVITHMRS